MAGLGLVMLLVPLGVILSQDEDEAVVEVAEAAREASEPVADTPKPGPEEVQPLPIEVQDAELRRLIIAHLEALGGVERVRETNSLIVSGYTVRGEVHRPFTSVRKRPRSWTSSYVTFEWERVDGYNGTQAWRKEKSLVSEFKTLRPISGTKLDHIRATSDFDDPIVRYVLADMYPGEPEQLDIRLEGEGALEGTPGYWIAITDDLGARRRVFLAGDSHLISFVEIVYAGRTTSIRYEDYRDVDGLMLPFSKTSTNSDTILSVVEVVEHYRVGEVVFDAVFTPVEE